MIKESVSWIWIGGVMEGSEISPSPCLFIKWSPKLRETARPFNLVCPSFTGILEFFNRVCSSNSVNLCVFVRGSHVTSAPLRLKKKRILQSIFLFYKNRNTIHILEKCTGVTKVCSLYISDSINIPNINYSTSAPFIFKMSQRFIQGNKRIL